jgi:reverse gyrase
MYVIGASEAGPVKLGISAQPTRRLSQLQTGHAQRLRLFHSELVAKDKARLLERLLHRDIGHLRAIGEWFTMTVEHAIAHIRFTIITYDDVDQLAEKIRQRRI